MSIALEVKDLSKIYKVYDKPSLRLVVALGFSKKNHGKDFAALDHVSFQIPKGKTLGIIGENGAGKSTLLKIITGVLMPTSGEVYIDGKVSALLELGTGFNPEYTGIENIYLNGKIMGLSREQIDSKVQEVIDFAEIGDFIYQKVKTYSSGMFARLAFAVAINVEPEILIVDEALAVGDMFFQQKCNMYMKEKMEHCTKLLVTHDMASIANMADEVIVLSKGKLVFQGEPLEAIEYYTKTMHSEVFREAKQNKEAVLIEETEEVAEFNKELETQGLSTDWIPISDESIGGALEEKIEAFKIYINEEPYKGYVKNGSKVRVSMVIEAIRTIKRTIIGYQIKDKFGNVIFGENTHSSGFGEREINKGEKIVADIEFVWPQIQASSYFLTLGLGEGDNEMQHTIQCWAHNIFEFRNISNLPDHGLFNQKIENFSIKRKDDL